MGGIDINRLKAFIYLDKRSVNKEDDCIEWSGRLSKAGYGSCYKTAAYRSFGINTAHRLSYFLENGTLTEGLQINHKCHNRKCINPLHLYEGTQSDNLNDMFKSGRRTGIRGVLNHNSKLSNTTVLQIRNEVALGLSQREIGLMHGVNKTTIRRIANGTRWGWL